MSLGCGSGNKEARWAATGCFATLACYDQSPARIERAREQHTHSALRFEVADAYQLDFESEGFDVIIFEDALHHFAPVETILGHCVRWLDRRGYLFVNEYTGPRKFQYSDRQLETANAILALLPENLRVSYEHGTIKRRVRRPSRLRMRLKDPSEAVESDAIIPTIHNLFDVVEERKLGGTLVNLVLDDIAHHFGSERDWLRLMFAVEDALMSVGEIQSDHTLIVARRRLQGLVGRD